MFTIIDDPVAPCRAALQATAGHVESLALRVGSTPPRFRLSYDAATTTVSLWCRELAALGRVEAVACRVAAIDACKGLESQAECERVRAAQLAAYAHLLEEGEEDVAGLALQLFAQDLCPPECCIAIPSPVAAAAAVLDACLYLRAIDPQQCTVTGPGLQSCAYIQRGHLVMATIRDSYGELAAVEATDVDVHVEGAKVIRIVAPRCGSCVCVWVGVSVSVWVFVFVSVFVCLLPVPERAPGSSLHTC